MYKIDLLAGYPRPRTSQAAPQNPKSHYLLRGLELQGPNQVWVSNITYIPLPWGVVYLVAGIDWYSRFVLSWQLSNTPDGNLCLDALHQALEHGQQDIFNTDQGAQCTAQAFTDALQTACIRISMDDQDLALDNILVERLWRTVKHKDIHIRDYASVTKMTRGLEIHFYNHERHHQSLDYAVPAAMPSAVKAQTLAS